MRLTKRQRGGADPRVQTLAAALLLAGAVSRASQARGRGRRAVTITDATTLAELRDELEHLGIVQIGVRLRIAKSTVAILGAARVGLGDYRTFEAEGGTIGEALAAASPKSPRSAPSMSPSPTPANVAAEGSTTPGAPASGLLRQVQLRGGALTCRSLRAGTPSTCTAATTAKCGSVSPVMARRRTGTAGALAATTARRTDPRGRCRAPPRRARVRARQRCHRLRSAGNRRRARDTCRVHAPAAP